MCIIVDANVAHLVLHPRGPHPDFVPVHDALVKGNGRVDLVYGGKLWREYKKVSWLRKIVRALGDAGRAQAIPDISVDAASST